MSMHAVANVVTCTLGCHMLPVILMYICIFYVSGQWRLTYTAYGCFVRLLYTLTQEIVVGKSRNSLASYIYYIPLQTSNNAHNYVDHSKETEYTHLTGVCKR